MEHPYLKHYRVKPGDFILDLGATRGDFLSEMLPEIKKQNAHILCVEVVR
jgi:23S rRNA U2552 (ribose-2'-O)-methylase RlmE/FtsJ